MKEKSNEIKEIYTPNLQLKHKPLFLKLENLL